MFVSSGWPAGLPPAAKLSTDKTIELSAGSARPGDLIVVWDRDTNDAAVRTASDVKGGVWSVRPEDFRYVGEVTVRVTHDGMPVAAAQVELADRERKQQSILDPSAKGEAKFFGVATGELKVRVSYRSRKGNTSEVRMGFELKAVRPSPTPIFEVSIQEPVEVMDAAPVASGGKATPAAQPASPVGSAIVYLAVLALAIALGYGAIRWIRGNQTLVAEKLKALGAQIPDPTPPPGAGQIAPSKPEPLRQIVLADATPVPTGSAAPTVSGQPRLVKEGGEAFELAEGETAVSREAGAGFALVGESTVSRKHARLTRTAGRVVVADLGSTNGTFVNGAKLTGETELKPGDAVQFGAVRFRFEA